MEFQRSLDAQRIIGTGRNGEAKIAAELQHVGVGASTSPDKAPTPDARTTSTNRCISIQPTPRPFQSLRTMAGELGIAIVGVGAGHRRAEKLVRFGCFSDQDHVLHGVEPRELRKARGRERPVRREEARSQILWRHASRHLGEAVLIIPGRPISRQRLSR